jgi:hypothetical protein
VYREARRQRPHPDGPLSGTLASRLDAYDASIVAEGIGTPSELATLQSLGRHYRQGYYLGRPAQMSGLPRQLSQRGASPTPVLRRGTVDPTLVLDRPDPGDEEFRRHPDGAGDR